jgi:hypothetical protein
MLAKHFRPSGSFNMSAFGPVNGRIDAHRAARCNNIRSSPLLTLMICGVVRAGQAIAGDQTPISDHEFELGLGLRYEADRSLHAGAAPASLFSAPFVSLNSSSEPQEFSATEFRPRKQGVRDPESSAGRNFLLDAPITKSNSVWQHMSDFRSQGRVRLLTLFQTRGSSLSLQAGKHGAPSLQWSTPWVRREGASRGLFDHLLPVPQHTGGGNAAINARGNMPHPTRSPTLSRPLDLAPASNTK